MSNTSSSSSSLQQQPCMICLQDIASTASIWVCRKGCYALFHLGCIQSHAVTSTKVSSTAVLSRASQYTAVSPKATSLSSSSSSSNLANVWRCPGCKECYGERDYPREYQCYCASTVNPVFDPFSVPHSCGGTCHRVRATCAHTCSARCHPGPCESCTQVVNVPCYCKKVMIAKRCGTGASSCGNKCQRTGISRLGGEVAEGIGIGRVVGGGGSTQEEAVVAACTHPCAETCHTGPCKPCFIPTPTTCACGKQKKTVPCFKRVWTCTETCNRMLNCGTHTCTKPCHSGPCSPCPTFQRKKCPCGATDYGPDLPCNAPAPKCGATCGKLMITCKGGPFIVPHTCERLCHEGPCGACPIKLEGSCRCGAKSKKSRLCCDDAYLCDLKCTKERNCGKHMCRRRCCLGLGPAPADAKGGGGRGSSSSSRATQRNTTTTIAAAGEEEDEQEASGSAYCPPCGEICKTKLSCGNHACEAYCHRGPCQPCPRTKILTCACGTSQLTIPCGEETRIPPPKCSLLCRKPPTCHHTARVPHVCHFGPCPPCTQMCGLPHARCGHVCPNACHADENSSNSNNTLPSYARPCLPCIVPVKRTCVGQHETREIACTAPSLFKCDRLCNAKFPCGKHVCVKSCHSMAVVVMGKGGIVNSGAAAAETLAAEAKSDDDNPILYSLSSCSSSPSSSGNGNNVIDSMRNSDHCGQVCTEVRPQGCTHTCKTAPTSNGACHAGPCSTCLVQCRRPCHCSAKTLEDTCDALRKKEAAFVSSSSSSVVGATSSSSQFVDPNSCHMPCQRSLPCGHACTGTCHATPCATSFPCTRMVNVRCKCTASSSSSSSQSGRREVWTCAKATEQRSILGISVLDKTRVNVLLPCDTSVGGSCYKGNSTGGANVQEGMENENEDEQERGTPTTTITTTTTTTTTQPRKGAAQAQRRAAEAAAAQAEAEEAARKKAEKLSMIQAEELSKKKLINILVVMVVLIVLMVVAKLVSVILRGT